MLTRNRIVFAVVFALAGAGVAALSFKGDPPRELNAAFHADSAKQVSPAELASWIIEGRRDFTVVDTRPVENYQASHVRDAVSCGSCHQSKQQARESETFVDLSKKIVLYAQSDADEIVLPKILVENPRLLRLSGGFEGWQQEILAPVKQEGLTSDEQVLDARRREARRAFFSGETPSAPAPVKAPVEPVRRGGPHKAAAAAEGC